MHIQLEVGWLKHPFPVSSFRVSSAEQLKVLRSLGLEAVRCIPGKSDPEALRAVSGAIFSDDEDGSEWASSGVFAPNKHSTLSAPQAGASLSGGEAGFSLAAESEINAQKLCDQKFVAAAQGYQEVVRQLASSPEGAMQTSSHLVQSYVADLLEAPSTTIRLLSESVGEQQGAHPINVTVLSLMLGKAHGLSADRLLDLGLAALLHDVGKLDLDPRCAERLHSFTEQQQQHYEEHVGASVAYGQRMGLRPGALTAIAQHHEAQDGSGFPLHLLGEDLSVEGQILALTNCYDKLCNPLAQAVPLTPHEALSALFAQQRGRFAREMVELFVRVMGVYPPGSVIQLSDDRWGLVVSSHGDHPLKPAVLLYHPEIESAQAEPVELSTLHGVVIKRSLRPAQLPREVLDYLSPRKRICYFFERAVPLAALAGDA